MEQNESADTRDHDALTKWGRAMTGGYQMVPNHLLVLQGALGLSSTQMVILLNLAMHWWTKENFPYITPFHMARRMGLSRRTVERQLRELCNRGLVRRVSRGEIECGARNQRTYYDLSGLVDRLESLPPRTKRPTVIRRLDTTTARTSGRGDDEDGSSRQSANVPPALEWGSPPPSGVGRQGGRR